MGFQCNYVIDNGLSIVSEAARVHPDLQGRGIMSKVGVLLHSSVRLNTMFKQIAVGLMDSLHCKSDSLHALERLFL